MPRSTGESSSFWLRIVSEFKQITCSRISLPKKTKTLPCEWNFPLKDLVSLKLNLKPPFLPIIFIWSHFFSFPHYCPHACSGEVPILWHGRRSCSYQPPFANLEIHWVLPKAGKQLRALPPKIPLPQPYCMSKGRDEYLMTVISIINNFV